MSKPYDLTPAHRLVLARAFRACPRVDTAIDCAIEGQLGRALVDDVERPTTFAITVGPFWYFAGEPAGPSGLEILSELPAFGLMMPSTQGWRESAEALFGSTMRVFPRYRFSAAALSIPHLEGLLTASPHRHQVLPIDAALAGRLSSGNEPLLDLADFASVADFLERSFGFTLLDGERPMGLAYASLVCSHSLEVSVFVDERYRRRGVATAVSAALLLESLARGLRPNWDAANPESCALAERLGFVSTGSYEACYHT